MSTLVGIRRPPEGTLGPISKSELLETVARDPSLSLASDALRWTGETKSLGMDFNFHDGEIWSVGTPDNPVLRKMQDIAHRLQATLVLEDGETFDLDAPSENTPHQRLTRGQMLFRLYLTLLTVGGLILFFILR